MTDTVKRTKVALIGILESKLDRTDLDPNIYIKNYKIPCFNRNRDKGGVACYIRSKIGYKLIFFLPNDIEFTFTYHIQYLDATHKTNHNLNYLQTPKLL